VLINTVEARAIVKNNHEKRHYFKGRQTMKPADVFGVAVRTIGLLVILAAVWAIFLGTLAIVGGGPGQVAGLLFFGIPALIVGLILLRGGADAIVRFAYPHEQ
jgi:hypothetical protein